MTEHSAPAIKVSSEQDSGGVLVGVLVALGDGGVPLVAYGGNPEDAPRPAQSVARLSVADIGRRVALLFEGGDRTRPVVMGCMLPSSVDTARLQVDEQAEQVIAATQRLVLRCGEASITLLADGTVHIKGRHLLSEASAANRLRGAAIHLN